VAYCAANARAHSLAANGNSKRAISASNSNKITPLALRAQQHQAWRSKTSMTSTLSTSKHQRGISIENVTGSSITA